MSKHPRITRRLAMVLALFAFASLLLPTVASAQEPQEAVVEAAPTFDPATLDPVTPARPLAVGCGSCLPNGTTDTLWGMGADCAAAESNLHSNLITNGANKCADLERLPCGIGNITIVTACHLYQGSYRIDGYAPFKCRICS